MKSILNLSKDALLEPKLKKAAVQIVRNVSGKGTGLNAKTQSSYIPTALT